MTHRIYTRSSSKCEFGLERVYLDAHATTEIDPILLDRYMTLSREVWGNPSSIHFEGRKALGTLLEAKQLIKSVLKVPARYDIFFFSNATEALNTLMKGIVVKNEKRFKNEQTILSTEVEHAAVFECISDMCHHFQIQPTFIDVGYRGAVSYDQVVSHIEQETREVIFAAFMAANNETGIITTQIGEIAQYLRKRSIPLIVDGVAMVGKAPVVFHDGISAYVFSGHKIHAPKGIAVAVVDASMKFHPLIVGGPQENRKRAGTENAPLALVFAEALKKATEELQKTQERLSQFQKQFVTVLKSHFPNVIFNNNNEGNSLPSTVNVAFPGLHGEDLLISLDMAGVSASHGSACSSGALEPSRVLLKMGIPYDIAASSIRFSWSRMTSQEEIDIALSRIIQTVKKLY